MGNIIKPAGRINGTLIVSGAKNASLLLLAAVVLATEKVVLDNIPPLEDVVKMCEILNILNIKTKWLADNTLEIDPRYIEYQDLDLEVCGEIRTSVLFVGVMLGRFGKVKVSSPGGCKLGARPINFHIDAMRKMGANISSDEKVITGSLKMSQDAEIHFGKVSVTGAVNALFCAVTRNAKTLIKNCPLEPEVDDCIQFLKGLGANVRRLGSTIIVKGGKVGGGVYHRVIPDRIEAGTFLILTVMLGGEIALKNVNPRHMNTVLEKLREVGANINAGDHTIMLSMDKKALGCDICACPYPGFPTDLQPQWSAMAAISQGRSKVIDTIYSSRFDHMFELEEMGAKYSHFEKGVVIEGVDQLHGANIRAQNLRSAAALVLAAKTARGPSTIMDMAHLYRGYYNFFGKLGQLQAVPQTEE